MYTKVHVSFISMHYTKGLFSLRLLGSCVNIPGSVCVTSQQSFVVTSNCKSHFIKTMSSSSNVMMFQIDFKINIMISRKRSITLGEFIFPELSRVEVRFFHIQAKFTHDMGPA